MHTTSRSEKTRHPLPPMAPVLRADILLFSAVAVWMGLIVLAPYLRVSESFWADPIYRFFHQACHQIAERSFSLWGSPLPVCHRCLGLYSGFIAGLILLPAWKFPIRILRRHPRWILLFFAPLLVDVVSPNFAASRFITGVVAAFPAAFFVKVAVRQVLTGTQAERGSGPTPTTV